ncbi:MAG: AraC family transcriptional regulator [Bacteroidetes bacterium]|uniref:AraC family transcriptional regulator n=1 Tax=Candidatus Cryptobacteroides merdavium TaxID=2840769 RepID=A0A9D9EDQ0_9BACT|nr:AraC family transcriptional regulator [Candidatus Cryptobacteroides merdavium]
MRHILLSQIADFADESEKLSDKLVLFTEKDFHLLDGYVSVGCRLMILVCEGSFEMHVNGHLFSLRKNNFMTILEGTRAGFGNVSADAEVFCIFTTRKFIMDSLQGLLPIFQNYVIRILTDPVIRLSDKDALVLKRQAGLMADALGRLKHRYRDEMVRLYMKGFVLELSNIFAGICSVVNDMPAGNAKKRDMLMAEFLDLVWKNLHETRTVSFYAKELCVTPKHLSRVVKEVSGKSPHEIISGEVLALSIQLLQNEDMLIQQIADILHFSDQASFSKFFKKYTGLSPAEYRRNRKQ